MLLVTNALFWCDVLLLLLPITVIMILDCTKYHHYVHAYTLKNVWPCQLLYLRCAVQTVSRFCSTYFNSLIYSFKYHCNSNCCIKNFVSVFSGISFPGIAESSNGTGDAVAQMSSSVVYRGKTDLIIHKGKHLGNATLHVFMYQ